MSRMHTCRSSTHVRSSALVAVTKGLLPSTPAPAVGLLPPEPLPLPAASVDVVEEEEEEEESPAAVGSSSHSTHTRSCWSRLITRAGQKKVDLSERAKTLAPTIASQRPQVKVYPDALEGVAGLGHDPNSASFRLRLPFIGGRPSHAGWHHSPQPPLQVPKAPSCSRQT